MLHFVANEDKYYIRFVEDPNVKFEFELDLNCDGGQELSKQIKNQKNIALEFDDGNLELSCEFPLLNEQSSTQEKYRDAAGEIVACKDNYLYFVHKDYSEYTYYDCQIIGKVINKEQFDQNISTLPKNNNQKISLVLAYEEIEIKIPEINKKIISIIIIGLIILIILLIIKLIAK